MSLRSVLVIDNYDSFVYNLVHLLEMDGWDCHVIKNDEKTVDEIAQEAWRAIVLSPGPKSPQDAGVCLELIKQLGDRVPILGICLGHQAIGQAYGAQVRRAKYPMHGKASPLCFKEDSALLPRQAHCVGRYHSLIVDSHALPSCLRVIAYSPEGEIMAMHHHEHPVLGLQFHPESILTEQGINYLRAFFDWTEKEA